MAEEVVVLHLEADVEDVKCIMIEKVTDLTDKLETTLNHNHLENLMKEEEEEDLIVEEEEVVNSTIEDTSKER